MCGVVKTDGYIRIFNLNTTIGTVIFLSVFFQALGKVYEESTEVLAERKYLVNDKWIRRFHRSCRPLNIQVPGMYFVDLQMSLTMGSFVIQNVVNMLIRDRLKGYGQTAYRYAYRKN